MMNTTKEKVNRKPWEKPIVKSISFKATKGGVIPGTFETTGSLS